MSRGVALSRRKRGGSPTPWGIFSYPDGVAGGRHRCRIELRPYLPVAPGRGGIERKDRQLRKERFLDTLQQGGGAAY